MITVLSKNIYETKNRIGDNYFKTFEDRCEDYIKKEMGIYE